jgi:hypothetical protein
MDEIQFLKRKISLKEQAIFLIKDEKIDLQIRAILILLKSRLERQMSGAFDPVLGRKLDCLTYLIEN